MLSELLNADLLAISIKLLNNFPLTRGCVESHLIGNVTAVGELIDVDIELYVLLFVVAHELKLDLKLSWSVLLCRWHYNMVRLLLLVCVWESHAAVDGNSLVEHEGLAVRLNTAELDLGTVVNERHFESLLHLPVWDLVAKLLEEKLHDVVTLSVDNHCSVVIVRRLLQVANDKVTTVLCA